MNTADITCDKMTENSNRKSNNNKWFDRVYLCYEDVSNKESNSNSYIKGFNCYRYKNFESANNAHNRYRMFNINIDIRHKMIPICKYIPEIFDRYFLDYYLINTYWLGKHIIYKKKNSDKTI